MSPKVRRIIGLILLVVGLGGSAATSGGVGLPAISWPWGGDSATPADRVLIIEDTANESDYSGAQKEIMHAQNGGSLHAVCLAAKIPLLILDKENLDLSRYPEWKPLIDAYKAEHGDLPYLLFAKGTNIHKGAIPKDATAQSVTSQIGGN